MPEFYMILARKNYQNTPIFTYIFSIFGGGGVHGAADGGHPAPVSYAYGQMGLGYFENKYFLG